MLRFWFDFGLDGLRMDAASGLAKDPDLPDFGFLADDIFMPVTWEGSPLWDVDGVHDILREWRAIADSYDGDRMYVGEVVVNGAERLARYMRPDELHTTFNLDFLKSPLDPARLRQTIEDTLTSFATVGAPATWTLSNHDETRHLTRYGRDYTGVPLPPPWPFPPSDRALGTRRARAVLLLAARSARVGLPVPGRGARPVGGRGPRRRAHRRSGLGELPAHHPGPRRLPGADALVGHRAAVRVQRGNAVAPPAGRVARPHRRGRGRPGGLDAALLPGGAGRPARRWAPTRRPGLTWLEAPDGVLAFHRGSFGCMINFSDQPVPVNGPVLISSSPVVDGLLGPDAAVWTSGLPGGDNAAQYTVDEIR